MKKLLTLFVWIFICALSTIAQTGGSQCIPAIESDWTFQGLEGKVKTIRTFKIWFSKDGKTGNFVESERELEEEFNFDSKGNQILGKREDTLTADSEDAITQVYVCNGKNIAEFKLVKNDGSLIKRTTYAYNDNGKISEKAVYFPDGTLERREKYTLDVNGKMSEEISTQQIHPEHFSPKRFDKYVTTKRTFKYDDRGNAIEEKHFYPNGSLYATWVSTYDDSNRIRKVVRTDNQNRLENLDIYTFDNSGRLLEKLEYNNNCYKGNQMCEGSLKTEIGVFYFGSKTNFFYDKRNNWKKQIQYLIYEVNGEKIYQPNTALYAELTYY